MILKANLQICDMIVTNDIATPQTTKQDQDCFKYKITDLKYLVQSEQ